MQYYSSAPSALPHQARATAPSTRARQSPYYPLAGSFSRRRSSIRPVWVQPSPKHSTPVPWHDPAVVPPSESNIFIAQHDWLHAMRAQTYFDFYAAVVVMLQLIGWARTLIWGDLGWPVLVNILLVLATMHGVWTAFSFGWKKVADIRGGYYSVN